MNDHRRGQQMKPEGDIAAARLAHAVAAVPPHREGEDAEAGDQHEDHRQVQVEEQEALFVGDAEGDVEDAFLRLRDVHQA